MKKNKWLGVLIAGCLVFAVSAFCLIMTVYSRLSDARYYEGLQTQALGSSYREQNTQAETDKFPIGITEESLETSTEKPSESMSTSEEEPLLLPQIDFDLLRSQNPEFAAWLYIPDTVISYPVVRTLQHPYSYYTSHLFSGKSSSTGCIFLDHNADPDESENVIVYGHHMKMDTMFHSLERYREKDFAESHRNFYLVTELGTYEATVFAVIEDYRDSELVTTEFDSIPREEWLQKVIGKSLIPVGTYPAENERIITLSTCTYTFDCARLMVIGTLKVVEKV